MQSGEFTSHGDCGRMGCNVDRDGPLTGQYGTEPGRPAAVLSRFFGLSLSEAGKLMTVAEVNAAMPAQIVPPAA